MGMFSRFQDAELLVRLAKCTGGTGHKSKEDRELAIELLRRPHLIFAWLLNAAGGGRVQKPFTAIREGFPCLSRNQRGKALRDLARRGWVIVTEKFGISFSRTLLEAREKIEVERLQRMPNRPSDPPSAPDGDEWEFSAQRIFQAVFGGWGGRRHRRRARVRANRMEIEKSHARVRAFFAGKGKRIPSISMIDAALRQLVTDGYAKVVSGSFDAPEQLVLTPLNRPSSIEASLHGSHSPPKTASVKAVTVSAPVSVIALPEPTLSVGISGEVLAALSQHPQVADLLARHWAEVAKDEKTLARQKRELRELVVSLILRARNRE